MKMEPFGKGAVTSNEFEHHLGVLGSRLNLEAVADNAGVSHEPGMVVCVERRDSGDVELGVGFTETGAFLQHGGPR